MTLARRYVFHLAIFLGVLLLLQAPRLGGLPAQLAAPVFSPDRGFLDFDLGYYPAAESILHDPSRLYSGARYDETTHRLQIFAPANFVNIPIVAWLFVPFTFFPLHQAEALWLAINIMICLICLFSLLKCSADKSPYTPWLITLAFVTSGPLMNALNLGQTTPAILLILLLAESNLRRQNETWAGICIGLAGLIKIPLLLFIPYFALRKRWRIAITAFVVLTLLSALSILLYGWPLHLTYFNTVFRANLNASIAAHNSQSIHSLVARLFTNASLWSWEPIVLSKPLRILQASFVVVVSIASGWAIFKKQGGMKKQRLLLELGIVMCVSLSIFPISWVHYGTWLLPVVLIAGSAIQQMRARMLAGMLLGLALLLINFPMPPPEVIQRFDNQTWFRIVISHQLFGTLLLLSLCIWCRVARASRLLTESEETMGRI